MLEERQPAHRERSRRANSASRSQAALYLNHPYGRPVIGWRHEIEKLDREDALAFYQRFYTPNNAILVVAGDVTADEVEALAEETYGKIARVAEIGRAHAPAGAGAASPRARVTLPIRASTQPSLQRSYLVPSATTAKPGEAEALEVLAQILGGGSNSRLYRTLVVEKRRRGHRRRLVSGHRARRDALRRLRRAAPGVTLQELETRSTR